MSSSFSIITDKLNLNDKQLQAVACSEGCPVLIIAGAGSGKTRVLTYRIAYIIQKYNIKPENILAITFTNKAANEMRERISKLIGFRQARYMWISTFHSACVRILRDHIDALGYKKNFIIYDSSDSARLIKQCQESLGIDNRQINPAAVASKISNLKNELISPKQFMGYDMNYFGECVSEIYTMYQTKLFKNNALDFDDLLYFTVKLFEKYPEILKIYQKRFHHILVDEYQDTNHTQYKIVSLLAPPQKNLYVVGDEDQSIYMWRGADVRNILEFESNYPDAKVVKLEQNYRSTRIILEAANSVVEKNTTRKPKKLWTENDNGEKIVKYEADSEHEEAIFIANEINTLLQQGYSYKDFAVFYRVNAQSRILEEVFVRYALPYKVVGGQKFYERREIKDILAYLKLLLNPQDSISLLRIINMPKRGIGGVTIARLEEYAAKEGISLFETIENIDNIQKISPRTKNEISKFGVLLKDLRSLLETGISLGGFIEEVATRSELIEYFQSEQTIEAQGRVENLEEFLRGVGEFNSVYQGASLELFLEHIALITDIDEVEEEHNSITLMTVHNAKGLEFPVVFMTGMEEGLFPHIKSLNDTRELEEERRLCYVGMTRAMELLYMTYARARSLYGIPSYFLQASRFINEIPGELFADYSPDSDICGDIDSKNTPTALSMQQFKIGQEVYHPKWGNGVVIDLINSDTLTEAEIIVNFSNDGEKRLALIYAPIRPA